MFPDFYIIGAQKAGTSFLHLCLKEHPDIFMPDDEMPQFEDPVYTKEKIEELKNILKPGRNFEVTGIKRPSYFGKPECAKRINQYTPKAKLIVILRNPVDRAISAYHHLIKMGLMPIKEPNEGLSYILSKGQYKKYPRTKWILEYGFYHKHLKRYYSYFPKKNIFVIFYKDLKKNPLKVVRKCYNFLEVNSSFKPRSLQTRPMKGIYSLSYLKFLRLQHPFLYTHDEKLGGVMHKKRNLFDNFMLEILRSTDKLIIKHLFRGKETKVSSRIKSNIYKYYTKDIEKLERLLNENLSDWKSPP